MKLDRLLMQHFSIDSLINEAYCRGVSLKESWNL